MGKKEEKEGNPVQEVPEAASDAWCSRHRDGLVRFYFDVLRFFKNEAIWVCWRGIVLF